MIHPLTPEYVRRLLDYNPETGLFTWRNRVVRSYLARIDRGWNKRFANKPVAIRRHRNGHAQIGLHCRNYMAHRVAWVINYGEWPSADIDHVNGDPSDNRISNLRLATASENLCNAKIRVNNTSGMKGVSYVPKKNCWYAYITKDKKMRSLGYHGTFDSAVSARKKAEKELHGKFARAA